MYAHIDISQEGYETKSMVRGLKNCYAPAEILDAFKREEMEEIPEEKKQNLSIDLVSAGVIKR